MSIGNETISPTFKSIGDATLSEGGLTKREYFAAKAMQGFIISESHLNPKMIRELSLGYADAVLEGLSDDK